MGRHTHSPRFADFVISGVFRVGFGGQKKCQGRIFYVFFTFFPFFGTPQMESILTPCLSFFFKVSPNHGFLRHIPESWRDSEIYGCKSGFMVAGMDLWCQHGDIWVRSWIPGWVLDPGLEGWILGLRAGSWV